MAGTVTVTHDRPRALGVTDRDPYLQVITITWTADAADGSVPNTAFGFIKGLLHKLVTNPGTPAPTALYDITIEDEDGVDVLGGAGANRSATVSEQAEILVTTVPPVVANTLTFKLAANSVNSATGVAKLYIVR